MKQGPPQFRRPESVLVVVYTGNADILLLHRVKPFAFWQSVTGSLRPRESHAQAAARELAEETGIESALSLEFSGNSREFEIDPRWRHRFAPGTTTNTEYEWRLRLPGIVDIRLDPAEHSDFRWLPIDAAIDAVWSWTNREALDALRNAL
ncbi:MAG: dihydroneopterin triphosphate diphosphatase [Gammaproteobacteria bacterium]|nr:dihydroneopterin triphosphate diphosphatase [Gammaproteobacteria bacterium]